MEMMMVPAAPLSPLSPPLLLLPLARL